mgnify:FL=1
MHSLYKEVSNSTKQVLYQFMKDEDISVINYHFNSFFAHCIKENHIKVTSHHFSNKKIEGLTIVDSLGTTFSYEKENTKAKQNFTLCHELGHYILKHDGSYFMKSVDNQEKLVEREANIFSAVTLMPDIVLLSKLYYNCESFQNVQDSLEVSKQALYFRLLDLLRVFFTDKDTYIKQAIKDYMEGQNAPLLLLLHDIKDDIIGEFNKYKPCLLNQIKNKIGTLGFVTSQDIPELLDQKQWSKLQNNTSYLKIWLVYNKGKSIAYVWDKNKLSESEARKKAELQLLLM